jgi:RimJ/RimL family protein N-acetyltransferase
VGCIDCGTFVRCTVYAGGAADGPIVIDSIDVTTGSTAFVVDPQLRRRGLGRARIVAVMGRPKLRSVALFEAGVEPENTASRRCLEAAGFHLRSARPDFEGMLYYRAWRHASDRSATLPP